jgi:predicted transposase YbfD/YdcC
MHATVESGHGREEEHYVRVIYQPARLPAEWPDMAAVLVGRERKVKGKNISTSHYDLTSRRGKVARLSEAIQGFWGIENGVHWVLDVAFGEDDNHTRDGHARSNLGLVRRLALSQLKQDPSKGSIKAERLSAALDDNYLLQI